MSSGPPGGSMDWRQQPGDALQAPHPQQQHSDRLEQLLRHKAALAAHSAGASDGQAQQQPAAANGGASGGASALVVAAQRRLLMQLRQQVAAAQAQQAQAPGTAGSLSLQPGGSLAAENPLLGQASLLGATPLVGNVFEVDSDLLERESDRVVSALSGGRAERAWALNALCVLSSRQEVRLGASPGLLAALLPVLQEGLANAVGLSSGAQPALPDQDAYREAEGLPPAPGWQARRAARTCGSLFPDRARLEEALQEAAAAACVLRNVAEVQQNSALLLDPPVMRCWTWSLNAARELVLQQAADSAEVAVHAASHAAAAGGGGAAADGAVAAAAAGEDAEAMAVDGGEDAGTAEDAAAHSAAMMAGLVVGSGPAADICVSLLQLTTVLSGRMLLPAFFECGMLLLRSLLIMLRPTWQQAAAAAGGAVLPPPLVQLAALTVTSVATAYQPNTDILLSMTGAPGGQPGAALMEVVADVLVCPFEVFRQHVQQQVDEETPGWRHLLPTDVQLLAEARRAPKGGARGAAGGGGDSTAAGDDGGGGMPDDGCCSTAEQCTLDMLAVLSQLRYLSAMLTLLWRLTSAPEPAGGHARAAAAGCPRLLEALCGIATHRWPQHPVRWHADGHTLRHPEAYTSYLRFLSHDMMPAMRERQELLTPLRSDASALLALLAADPKTRKSIAWCEGQLATAVMSGTVPATEPGVSALLARFAAQGEARGGGEQAPDAAQEQQQAQQQAQQQQQQQSGGT